VTKLFAAGGATFYRELLDAAGAVNVYTDSTPAYPSFSSEAVAYMAPDIIIDLMASVAGMDPQRVKADWDRMTMVPAVKNRMVFCLSGDHVTIPGPRISYILEDFKRIVRSYRDSIEQDAGI